MESTVKPWSAAGMRPRRDWVFERIRRDFRKFVSADGVWQSPPGVNLQEDPRVFIEVALPYLLGDAADRELAHRLLLQPSVRQRINNCAFCNEYLLTLYYCAGEALPAAWAAEFLEPMRGRLTTRYATKDLQHHGYNDNHVTLATSTLVLGGQLLDDPAAVAAGRDNLLNFRDTLLRRGFIHEMNDCYLVHTLYTTAIVGQFARDPEIRQLARDCEARIWFDFAAHWHPNLGRKLGPSARDYTGGRLFAPHVALALWGILGDRFQAPLQPPELLFQDPKPAALHFRWQEPMEDNSWNLGFLGRILAHGYEVPERACQLFLEHRYPFVVEGTHEVGSAMESYRPAGQENPAWSSPPQPVPGAVPFAGGEVYTYNYYERDWGMGTASGRMIGGCPNNNFEIAYRKRAPLTVTADQGLVFSALTVNGKNLACDREFLPFPGAQPNRERTVAWFDQGFYAGFQHRRSSVLLYRPRVGDSSCLSQLATTIIYPLPFGNRVEHLELGDTVVADFEETAVAGNELFLAEGPVFIGFRFLCPRPQSCAGPRLRVHREKYWGFVDWYLYDGPEVALTEPDLARLGGGFYCEVGTRDQFPDLAAFKAHFRSVRILDDQNFMMRQVRVRHPEYLMGLRYDALADRIIYRMLDNRELTPPQFHCSELAPEELPFLTGPAAQLDGFDWAERQAARPPAAAWPECGVITGAGCI